MLVFLYNINYLTLCLYQESLGMERNNSWPNILVESLNLLDGYLYRFGMIEIIWPLGKRQEITTKQSEAATEYKIW